MITLRAAGQKDTGLVREINEDEFFVQVVQSSDAPPLGLFVVADGVGGQAGGELASEWAVKTIWDELADLFIPPDPRRTRKLPTAELAAMDAASGQPTRRLPDSAAEQRIVHAVQRANQVVRGIASARPDKARDTGTTVTLALIRGDVAIVANVGDSRTYLLRHAALTPITEDHSVVASLVRAGQITPDEVTSHPQRNLIYRSLGNAATVEVDLFCQPLQPGDQLLLCSDGLWEMVRDPQIAVILGQASSPAEACQRLIATANQNGGEDNIAVVVIWAD